MGTGFWVTACRELVVCVCADLLFAAHDELILWYVPFDAIKFSPSIVWIWRHYRTPTRTFRRYWRFLIWLSRFNSHNFLTHGVNFVQLYWLPPGSVQKGADTVFYNTLDRRKIDHHRELIALAILVWCRNTCCSSGCTMMRTSNVSGVMSNMTANVTWMWWNRYREWFMLVVIFME